MRNHTTAVSVALTFMLAGITAVAQTPAGQPTSGGATSTTASAVTIGDNNTIRLPLDNARGDLNVLVVISNVPAGPLRTTAPSVSDSALTGTAAVTFAGAPQQVQNDATVAWLFRAAVTTLSGGASDSHLAKVTLGEQSYMRTYTLTNRPAGTQTWSVTPPGAPWVVNWTGDESRLTVTVTTQDVPVTGLYIAQSTLRDDKNLVAINRDDFEWVDTTGQSVPAHATRALDIRLKGHGLFSAHGKFTGNMQFGASSMPDLQTAAVTLYASSVWMRLLGAALIAIGLSISRVVVHQLRPRIARAQALRPVILVRRTAASLIKELDALASPDRSFPTTRQRLSDLHDRVSVENLDAENLLPVPFDLPIAAVVDASTKLQQRLTTESTNLDAVATVMRNGIAPAVKDLASDVFDAAQVNAALDGLDALGGTVESRTDALPKIATLLASYRAPAAGRALADVSPEIARRAAADPVTIAQANFIIEHASNVGWILLEVTTFAVGVVLLVLPNPGFAWIDAVYCLLWGVGIPTAGAGFQSMTPSSVATAIGVGVPKSGA